MDPFCPLHCCFREKRNLLPHYEVTGPVRPNSNPHIFWVPVGRCTSLCSTWPLPASHITVPDLYPPANSSQNSEVLTGNPVLSKWSPFAESPVQPQQPSHGRRSRGAAAKRLPEQQWSTSLPRAQHPRGCRLWAVPRDSCQPLPSFPFAPACKEFDSILRVPLFNICTLDKMLLFLSLLIPSSSFNCSLWSFFQTSGWHYFILSLKSSAAFAIYRHFSRAESQYFLGYGVTCSRDYPTIHPPSASWVKSEKKKQYAYFSLPKKYILSH